MPIHKQLQEISFYSFLEHFFYNPNVLVSPDADGCEHSFHQNSKIIFMVDILRVEFLYHPVETYELDLTCFKQMPGSLTETHTKDRFK